MDIFFLNDFQWSQTEKKDKMEACFVHFDSGILIKQQSSPQQLNKIKIQAMSSDVPLLTLEQVEELNYMVHGILQQNKKKLDETLGELVEISSTSILALYRLVTEQWAKKQKIVENLCHFSLTMMATVQYLWQQKDAQAQRLQAAEVMIRSLQKQLDEAMDINQIYKQKISEAETHIESIAQAKEKIEEYVRSQSCIDFSGQFENKMESLLYKKCSAYEQCENIGQETVELIRQSSVAMIEKEAEIQNLREEKKKLQLQLQEAIQEKQLTKMELQLAEIAIQDALTYKTSFRSLIQSNSSKLDDRPKMESNIHYYNGDIDCQSLMDDSFNSESKNVLSNQFTCRQDIIHFASTPCLLLNDSIDKIDLDQSVSSLQDRLQEINPFKKKASEAVGILSSQPSKPDEGNHENAHIIQQQRFQEHFEQQNKTFDLKNQSFNDNFEPSNYPESAIINDNRASEFNKKAKEGNLKIQDKEQTYESSLISTSPYRPRKDVHVNRNKQQQPQKKSNSSIDQNSISKFYSFVSKKLVRNRIKVK